MLKEIHIEPMRHFQAPHNWLYYNDKLARPITCAQSRHPNGLVLIAGGGYDGRLMQSIKRQIGRDILQISFSRYIQQQIYCLRNAPEKTILDHCLDGQEVVFALFKKHLQKNQVKFKKMQEFGLVSAHKYQLIDSQQATLCLKNVLQLDFRPYLRNGDDLIVDAALPMHLIDKHKMLELKRLLKKAGMDFQFGFVKNICCMLIREVNQPGFYKKINTFNQMQKTSHAAPLSTNPGPPLIHSKYSITKPQVLNVSSSDAKQENVLLAGGEGKSKMKINIV